MTLESLYQIQMTQHHARIKGQLADLNTGINTLLCEHNVKLDLLAMHCNARKIWAKLDNERIECRKRGRLTARYESFNSEIQALFKIMDREVFWQKLH